MRKLLLFLTAFVLSGGAAIFAQQSGTMTEEQKKRAFLKAREEIKTVPATPSPGSSPRPKPKPVRPAMPDTEPEPKPATPKPTTPRPTTPRPTTPRPQPEPEMPPKPKPKLVPEATPRPRPPSPPPVTPRPVTPRPTTPRPTTPKPESTKNVPSAPIVIEKEGGTNELEPAPQDTGGGGWGWFGFRKYKYLTRANRSEIDRAPVQKRRWRYLVVHNSGTRQGNAKAFEYYHRKVRKMPNGMAYQFVIGNGRSSGDGAIEIGSRWRRQINGGHVHSDYLNHISIGICLVGDFNRDKPTAKQQEALEELIRYLRGRVGKTDGKVAIVRAHRQINPPRWPTDCPGNRFPYSWLRRTFD